MKAPRPDRKMRRTRRKGSLTEYYGGAREIIKAILGGRPDSVVASFTQLQQWRCVETKQKAEPLEAGLFIMEILWMLIIGLVIGVVAKLLMPGRDPGGFIITIVLGIAGSFVAGFVGRALHWYSQGQPAGFIASVIGAILLLVLYRLFQRRTA